MPVGLSLLCFGTPLRSVAADAFASSSPSLCGLVVSAGDGLLVPRLALRSAIGARCTFCFT